MNFRLRIPKSVIEEWRESTLADTNPNDLVRDAITLFNWAVMERKRGRIILSANEQGQEMLYLSMPSLENIAQVQENDAA